ncbi:general secretion pathway protein GspB [Candidatus Poribacteria bacterium]|nr:general secretion pathway protein GspB [Candidatus Poribacteria bacterium]
MSIILKALKKVQDQKSEAPPEPVIAGLEKFEEHGADAPDFPPSEAPAPLSAPPEMDAAAALAAPKSNRSSSAIGISIRERSPARGFKILLGSILVLGLLTTAWFVNTIYSSSKHSPAAGEPTNAAYVLQQPEPMSAPPQSPPQADSPLAAAPPERPVTPQTRPAREPVPALAENTNTAAAAARRASAPPDVPEEPYSPTEPALKEHRPAIADEQIEQPKPRHGKEKANQPKKPKEPGGKPELKINAIAWRDTEPRAVVNMQTVYVGDTVEGATVKTISPGSVTFEYEGETFEVRF